MSCLRAGACAGFRIAPSFCTGIRVLSLSVTADGVWRAKVKSPPASLLKDPPAPVPVIVCRLENRSFILPLRFRQAGTSDEAWEQLLPGACKCFAWENPQGLRLLEVMADGAEMRTARRYRIDEEAELEPQLSNSVATAPLMVSITREPAASGGSASAPAMRVCFKDWQPSDLSLIPSPEKELQRQSHRQQQQPPLLSQSRGASRIHGASSSSALASLDATRSRRAGGGLSQSRSIGDAMSEMDGQSARGVPGAAEEAGGELQAGAGKQLLVEIRLDEFGLSLVDHTPEEILYFSMSNAVLSYDTNLRGSSRSALRKTLHRNACWCLDTAPHSLNPCLHGGCCLTTPLPYESPARSRDALGRCPGT